VVKFQEYYVNKPYKHRVKKYRGVLLRIPKKFQPKVDPFLGVDLAMKDIVTSETANERVIDIVLVIKNAP
jgi:hypothetical protein